MKEETIFNFKEESAKGGFAPRRPLWKPLLDFEVMPLGAKRQRPLWEPLLNLGVSGFQRGYGVPRGFFRRQAVRGKSEAFFLLRVSKGPKPLASFLYGNC